MHSPAMSAPVSQVPASTDQRLRWGDQVSRALVALACLTAGATLVALATPTSQVAAGAAGQADLPHDTVLLDFTAKWCPPCQEMSPIVDRLSQQGYPVQKVDVDADRDTADRFGIKMLPTFVLLVNGREVMRQTYSNSAAETEAQIRRMLQQIPEWQRRFAEQSSASRTAVTRGQNSRTAEREAPAESLTVDLGKAEPPPKSDPPRSLFGMFEKKRAPGKANPEPAAVRAQSRDDEPISVTEPLQASVRLRVKDRVGMNFGSGTIIDQKSGQTLILTCGHLFRELDDKGVVEVDVFDAQRRPQTFIARVIDFNLDADVGLIAITTTRRLPVMKLAALDQSLPIGEKVLGIGCGGGEPPSREELAVTAVNKYDGPENWECTGLPVQGRSGGGLFRAGEIIGVCIAADREARRGVYAGLKPVFDLVEKNGFGAILPVGRPKMLSEVAQAAPAANAAAPASSAAAPFVPKSAALPPAEPDFSALFSQAGETKARPEAVVEQLRSSLAQTPDAEIIIIVRPKHSPAPSRVVVVNQASPKLLGYLLESAESRDANPTLTEQMHPAPRSEVLTPTAASSPARSDPVAPFTLRPQRPLSPRQSE